MKEVILGAIIVLREETWWKWSQRYATILSSNLVLKSIAIFKLERTHVRVEEVLSKNIYPMKNNWKVSIITENLPGTKSVKKIPGIGGLIGQVCSVTKFLFVYSDKPVPINQATHCLWYVAVEWIKKHQHEIIVGRLLWTLDLNNFFLSLGLSNGINIFIIISQGQKTKNKNKNEALTLSSRRRCSIFQNRA